MLFLTQYRLSLKNKIHQSTYVPPIPVNNGFRSISLSNTLDSNTCHKCEQWKQSTFIIEQVDEGEEY